MAHTYGSCLYHYVFSTRNRENLIDPAWLARLWAYMAGIAKENEMNALSIGGTENHVHALMLLPPSMAPAKGIQLLKGNASKWVHEDFPHCRCFEWQQGYGVFTIGFSQIQKTRDYIDGQQERHRHRSYEDEYRAFLRMHMIEYDDDYVFG